jgi:hypothetical protein
MEIGGSYAFLLVVLNELMSGAVGAVTVGTENEFSGGASGSRERPWGGLFGTGAEFTVIGV